MRGSSRAEVSVGSAGRGDIQSEIGKQSKKTPSLKNLSLLTGLLLQNLTTLTMEKTLRRLRMAVIGLREDPGPMRHIKVLSRLSEVLDPIRKICIRSATVCALPGSCSSTILRRRTEG